MGAKYTIDVIHTIVQGITTGILAPTQPITVDWYSAVSPSPSVDSVLADFTLFSSLGQTGYATINIASWTDNGRQGDGWEYVSNNLVWTNSGGSDWTSALGLVLITAGVLVGYIEFASGVVVGPGSSETITINPDDINRY